MPRRDEASFDEFMRGASPRLLSMAWLLTGSRASAEDLVQGALERAYVAWPRIQSGAPLAYTRRILVNLHIDTGRRRRGEYLTDDVPDRLTPDTSADVDLVDHLTRALATLPSRERQCVVLRFHADLPEAEVAEVLSISVGTVKSSTSRGLAKLRALLVPQGACHV